MNGPFEVTYCSPSLRAMARRGPGDGPQVSCGGCAPRGKDAPAPGARTLAAKTLSLSESLRTPGPSAIRPPLPSRDLCVTPSERAPVPSGPLSPRERAGVRAPRQTPSRTRRLRWRNGTSEGLDSGLRRNDGRGPGRVDGRGPESGPEGARESGPRGWLPLPRQELRKGLSRGEGAGGARRYASRRSISSAYWPRWRTLR